MNSDWNSPGSHCHLNYSSNCIMCVVDSIDWQLWFGKRTVMGKPVNTSSAYDPVPTLMHVQDVQQNQTNAACPPEIWGINLNVLLFLGVYTKLDCINSSPFSAALWPVSLSTCWFQIPPHLHRSSVDWDEIHAIYVEIHRVKNIANRKSHDENISCLVPERKWRKIWMKAYRT